MDFENDHAFSHYVSLPVFLLDYRQSNYRNLGHESLERLAQGLFEPPGIDSLLDDQRPASLEVTQGDFIASLPVHETEDLSPESVFAGLQGPHLLGDCLVLGQRIANRE
jgi:hypothetical protein